MKTPIKIIDLFAGPGGLGEGFASVGSINDPTFKISVSVEKEKSAHKTLTLRAFTREFKQRKLPKEYYQYVRGEITKDELVKNYPLEWSRANIETLGRPTALGEDNEIIHNAIDKALGKNEDPWVLIGGPPCQAYSLAGRARNIGKKGYVANEDNRHFLYKEYLNVIKKFQPSVFVMENVKGMLSSTPSGTPIFGKILEDLKEPDDDGMKYKVYSISAPPRSYDAKGPVYDPRDFIVKAEDYGVPQARHRVILLGVRSDHTVSISDLLLQKVDKVSLGSVLQGMPELRSGLSRNDSFEGWKNIVSGSLDSSPSNIEEVLPKFRGSKFIKSGDHSFSKNLPRKLLKWLFDPKLGGILDHQTRGHMASDICRYAFVSSFWEKFQRSPRLGDFPENILPNHKNVKSNKFVDRFKVQLKDMPATTITSHIAKDGHYFIHYDPFQCRSLTLREAARAQTFPENYYFEGNRTQQYVQVGNAVPPFLAFLIGSKIKEIICKHDV